jgi:hypothetical protein
MVLEVGSSGGWQIGELATYLLFGAGVLLGGSVRRNGGSIGRALGIGLIVGVAIGVGDSIARVAGTCYAVEWLRSSVGHASSCSSALGGFLGPPFGLAFITPFATFLGAIGARSRQRR